MRTSGHVVYIIMKQLHIHTVYTPGVVYAHPNQVVYAYVFIYIVVVYFRMPAVEYQPPTREKTDKSPPPTYEETMGPLCKDVSETSH